jgi:AmpE protein
MTFINILAALIIERFFDWNHIRRWTWFINFQKWVGLRISKMPAYLVLALTILPAVLVVALLNHLLAHGLYGVLKLLLGVVILVYCLGPTNFWAEAYTSIGLLHADDNQAALEKIKNAFGVMVSGTPEGFHRAFTNALFIEANRRVFAVIFWFMLLGPAGAVLYRQVDLCRLQGISTTRSAGIVQLWLDWLPVRVFTFLFALAGHFIKVIQFWKHDVFTPPKMNDTLLSECGIAALDVLQGELMPVDGLAEKATISLLDRAFVIGLVILAIIVLI